MRPATWVVVLTFCSHTTDRCYTCSSDEPFCHWQTYIDTKSPTLSWFSCVTTRLDDETFYAASVTNHLLPSQTSGSSPTLSVGGIVGIAVGGGVFLITCVALVVYFCFRRRRTARTQEQSAFEPWWRYSGRQTPHEMPVQSEATEIDSYPAAVEGAKQRYYQPGAWKSAQPVAELPE